jgi:uncharacterized OB-fold protein
MADEDVLSALNVVEYPFTRTTGPVIGAFFTALREGFIVGIKGSDGTVIVPPVEYDPVTSESLTELVEVGDSGEVVSWAWVTEPIVGQPIDGPFAWGLIKLDGAGTAMVHAIDTGGDPRALSTGARVKARWRAAKPAGADDVGGEATDGAGEEHQYREGHILDIECFVPEGGAS